MSTSQPKHVGEQVVGENDDNGPANDSKRHLSTSSNSYQPIVVRGRGKPKANSLDKFADNSIANHPPRREPSPVLNPHRDPSRELHRTRSKAWSPWVHDRYRDKQEPPQLQATQEGKVVSSQPLDPFGAALKYIMTNVPLSRDQLDELVRSVMVLVEKKHEIEQRAARSLLPSLESGSLPRSDEVSVTSGPHGRSRRYL